jgi:hypothetical protein
MNLVSLLILPAVINLSNIDKTDWLKTTPKPAGLVIAGAALVVLLGAILFSKRSGAGIVAGTDDTVDRPVSNGSSGGASGGDAAGAVDGTASASDSAVTASSPSSS